MSSLFAFDLLLQLSTSAKYNSNLIYELITDQPLYFSSIKQIKLFHNTYSLTIPKYDEHEICNNLSNLTHIKNIKFHRVSFLNELTKLTHLTACVRIENNCEIKYFHTNLKNLFDFSDNIEQYNINDIISFTRLTHLTVNILPDKINFDRLSPFVNLRSLDFCIGAMLPCKRVIYIFESISTFTRLDRLIIRNIPIGPNTIQIVPAENYDNLTHISIFNCKHCIIQNCKNLKYLQVYCCETITMDKYRLKLQTLILNSHDEGVTMKLNFDWNECIDLRHFECNVNNMHTDSYSLLELHEAKKAMYSPHIRAVSFPSSKATKTIYLSSQLIKLNSLSLQNPNLYDAMYLSIDKTIANNLTYLKLENYVNTFDFVDYINLQTLIIYCSRYINFCKFTRLQSLSINNTHHTNYHNTIHCKNYLNLTHLEMKNFHCSDLCLLTKLKTLIWRNMRIKDWHNVWNHNIEYLSKLRSVHLFVHDDDLKKMEVKDRHYLSSLKLKEFDTNTEHI